MRRKKGFTLVEVIIAVVVVAILAGFGWGTYSRFIERSKSAEAVVNLDAIRKAELGYRAVKGTFAEAGDVSEINQALGLEIVPKYYEYKIINASQDNFLAIAQRAGESIQISVENGSIPLDTVTLAMDASGLVAASSGSGSGSSGGSSGGSTGGGSSGGSSGGGSSGGGSSGGGSTGGGSTGGGSTGGGSTGGGSTGGGSTGGIPGGGGPPVTYSSDILEALQILADSTIGAYFRILIQEYNISITWGPMGSGTGAYWLAGSNKIVINDTYQNSKPNSLVASLIAHEATHADYSYKPDKWIASTLASNPLLTLADLHIDVDPWDSIDQEYNCFANQLQLWNEKKGTDTDYSNDSLYAKYAQGESDLKDWIRYVYRDRGYSEY